MSSIKFETKTAFYTIRLSVIAILCACCALILNHFYQVKRYSIELSKELNIFVFFNKDFEDKSYIYRLIQATGVVVVREYVDAQNAYLKAVEKNSFLKDIFVPGIPKSIQAYAIVSPKYIPNEQFLSCIRNKLEKIHDVDEVVFNVEIFKHYIKIGNLLLFYRKIFVIFLILILILAIYKCIFFITAHSYNVKKIMTKIFLYVVSSMCGFLVLWTVCICMHYPLLVDYGVVLLLITPFVASIGVLLE